MRTDVLLRKEECGAGIRQKIGFDGWGEDEVVPGCVEGCMWEGKGLAYGDGFFVGFFDFFGFGGCVGGGVGIDSYIGDAPCRDGFWSLLGLCLSGCGCGCVCGCVVIEVKGKE